MEMGKIGLALISWLRLRKLRVIVLGTILLKNNYEALLSVTEGIIVLG